MKHIFSLRGIVLISGSLKLSLGHSLNLKHRTWLHTYIRGGQIPLRKQPTLSKLIISNNYKFKLIKFVNPAVFVTAGIVQASGFLF